MDMQLNKRKLRSYKEFLMILPFLAVVAIFSYFPLYGWVYAFHDYRPPFPITKDTFVGLKWFETIISNPTRTKNIIRVLRNTFAMSGISLAFSWFPMVFAIFLNEIKCEPYKKFVQTVTTRPNFISWVLVYSIAFNLFGSFGAVNTVLQELGLIDTPIAFMKSSEHVWFTQWLWLTWKNAGWAAIMYLAAITGIDQQMYEAADIDGAKKMQKIWYITLPSIRPTILTLFILEIGHIMTAGFDQIFNLYSPAVYKVADVLDTYTYRQGIEDQNYSYATAAGLFQNIVGFILVILSNWISKKLTDGEEGLW